MKIRDFLFFLLILSGLQGFAQSFPYADDLRRFRETDSLTPPPQHEILFIGSSSFTLWKDVGEYFTDFTIINRAYGGSCLTDLIRDFQVIVPPYNPRQVVIYCGENDFASDDTLSPGVVLNRFTTLFSMIRKQCPSAKITYVSMKPSPSRWHLRDKYMAGNKSIRNFLKKQPNTSFVNVWDKMLDKNHQLLQGIFLEDQLHLNASGYSIWQKTMKHHLLKK
jgi:lysophospholipase L1-like esterase